MGNARIIPCNGMVSPKCKAAYNEFDSIFDCKQQPKKQLNNDFTAMFVLY